MGKDTPKVIAGMDTSLQDYRADMWKHFTAEMPELAKIPVVGTIGDKTFNVDKLFPWTQMLFSFLLTWKNNMSPMLNQN